MTRSPYVLKDQTLNSTIRVKAVDKAGNEYIATFIPDASLRVDVGDRMLSVVLLFMAGVLVLVLLAITFVLVRRRRKSRQEVPDEVEDTEFPENNNETHHE